MLGSINILFLVCGITNSKWYLIPYLTKNTGIPPNTSIDKQNNTSALQLGSALHSSMSTLTQDANPLSQAMCKGCILF